jgi:hypothetical protein
LKNWSINKFLEKIIENTLCDSALFLYFRNFSILNNKYSLFLIVLWYHIKSAVYTFSVFFLGSEGTGPLGFGFFTGALAGPFKFPNKLFAIFCFAFSSGVINGFFSFFYSTGAVKAGGFGSRDS